ncbi:MAG: tyrosine-type recombinase/integrase [Oleiphilus sp.]
MSRNTDKLSAVEVKNAACKDKPYKLSDGGGLYLLINPNETKYWRLAYRFAGKQKLLAIGVYPDVSLKDARIKREDAKKSIREGNDPGFHRKKEKREKILSADNSFKSIALEWWDLQQKGRWIKDHATKILNQLEKDIFPDLGSRPIKEIEPAEILEVIRRVERRGALDVARRELQHCNKVFAYAIQTSRATVNPARDLGGALEIRKTQHQKSLSRAELPSFFKELAIYEGNKITTLALRLLVNTFCRPGEIRFAVWSEFDFKAKEWRIPAERMKMKTEHIVPLSKQALDVLEELKPITGHYDLLFPGERSIKKPISENTMNYALYRMGYKDRATAHGFRATASSILNEEGFNRDAIERQLAHMERNKVRGAYTHHAQYLKERKEMMQWWSNYLERIETENNVVVANFG